MRPYLAGLLNRWLETSLFTYLLPNYMIMVCLGAFVGTLWAARRARARGLDPDPLLGLVLWAFPIALLGGRLLHWSYSPGTYASLLDLLDPIQGDSLAYGGFIAGTATAVLYLRLRGAGVLRYLDCAAPALGLATAFTRVGCFLDGCDFGSLTASPLAVRFPAGSPAYLAQVEAGLLSPGAAASLPVHPVQLYLVLKGLGLAALVAWLGRSRRRLPGEEFCAFWVLYALARFGLEFFRGDPARGFLGPLSTSQAVSIPVFILALLGLVLRQAGPRLGAAARRRALSGTRETAAGERCLEEAAGSAGPPGAPTPPAPAARWALREALLATLLAAALVKAALGGGSFWAWTAPAVWIYLPVLFSLLDRTPLCESGFALAAWRRGGGWLLASAAAVLLPFALLLVALRAGEGRPPELLSQSLGAAAALDQLLFIAIPEELFFRGYLHSRLSSWAARRALGTAFPVAAGALLFALAHLLVEPGWLRAAVFFPGLVLGWLRTKTGGLLAPAGFHWLANLLWIWLGR